MFLPKIFTTLKGYSREQFVRDLIAGVVVGIVALPLCIAFAIASGVSPEKGLITGVVGGFLISFFGGSRVQIGGPTGAFIVIVYGVVMKFGTQGLIYATLLAGIMLVIMGLARMGSVIKFIPHSLIVGFTSGIALIIFSSQIKDLFGLEMGSVPSDFSEKWQEYFLHFSDVNYSATIIGIATVLLSMLLPRITHKVPGSLIAILLTTFAVQVLHLDVETIGSRFGEIPSTLPMPEWNLPSWNEIQVLIQPAFTIALLGGIESLLSAVVADGMIGGNHKSNMELIAQGIANIGSALFAGIPATGAIARTATNVKSGGRTPVAGIVHALVLLAIMLAVGQWASLIPMACLAGILVVVSYNMSEWQSFIGVLRTSRSDGAVLLATFLLTVWVDLTIAIEIGMVLAAFLFMHKMTEISNVSIVTRDLAETEDLNSIDRFEIPNGVEVFEVTGPLFFGAAYKFKESLKLLAAPPPVLIIRMRSVPVIDETGLHTLKEVHQQAIKRKTQLVLSGVQPGIREALKKSGLYELIGAANITGDIHEALKRANQLLS